VIPASILAKLTQEELAKTEQLLKESKEMQELDDLFRSVTEFLNKINTLNLLIHFTSFD
jgi:hypothetical protein